MDKLRKDKLEKEGNKMLLENYKTALPEKINEMKYLQYKLQLAIGEVEFVEQEIERLEKPQ